MNNQEWFVILNESESVKCETPAQLLVYLAVKSFCSNGRSKKGISLREISSRSKYSVGWTKPVIEQLKKKGLVFTHGTETRRGGTVEVFAVGTLNDNKVSSGGTVKNNRSVPPVKRSVPRVAISVPPIGTKSPKVKRKKVNNTKQQKTKTPFNKNKLDTSALKGKDVFDVLSSIPTGNKKRGGLKK